MNRAKIRLLTLLAVFLWGTFAPFLVVIAETGGARPPIANYFLNWDLNEAQARELSRWNLVVLDMEIQYRRPDLIKKMRTWNPNIKIIVYITSQEVRQDAATSYSVMRQRFAAGIPAAWYLAGPSGERLTWWSGTYLLNVTPDCPVINGQRFSDYLVNFVDKQLLATGLWDGVFYDNAWDNITYFVGKNVDANRDSTIDTNPDAAWRAGMKNIYQKTRSLYPGITLIGNGTTRQYQKDLNGSMLENFIPGAWSPTMETYKSNATINQAPQVSIINANTLNTGMQNYRAMRFGLGSTLLENGYFSYDHGDQNHGQTWWYDEYSANLGTPLGRAISRNSLTVYKPDVWRRDFEHGLVVVNSTAAAQAIDLGGEYEKINGSQDRTVNDGSIVTEVELAPEDSVIVLKTTSKINDIVFTNGDFARFYRADGGRVRNGYFVFDDAYKGGDQVLYTDLDSDGARDTVVASGNKVTAWKSDGQLLFKVYPYTANYKGNVRITVGNLDTDSTAEIYVAPNRGAEPIKIYNLVGEEILPAWYPLGKKYSGGYSLAIAGSGPSGRIIVGSGTGVAGKVSVHNAGLHKMVEWPVFDKKNIAGLSVAAGDLDGNGAPEIAVGFGNGTYPTIKTYDIFGKTFAPDAVFKSQVFRSAKIQITDVDFDGKDDLVLLTAGTL